MKRGRKPISDKTISVASRLPMSLVPKLKEYTDTNNTTTSAFIQELLEAALDSSRGAFYTRDEVNRMLAEKNESDNDELASTYAGYIEELETKLHDTKALLEQFKDYATELEVKLKHCTDLYRSESLGFVSSSNYKKITPTLKRPK